MKMFLTRLGEGSRMVVTGDPSQVDLPSGITSGLADAVAVLKDIKGVATMTFSNQDIVRHAMVGRIVAAYDKQGEKAAKLRK
jgi:phosphate starvation-inducible PhoH-like protein